MNTDETNAVLAEMLHHRSARLSSGKSVAPPLVPASKFFLPGTPDADYHHGRAGNPTWTELEEALGLLEQAEVVVFPSGMAATSAVLLTHLAGGDRVLISPRWVLTTPRRWSRAFCPRSASTSNCEPQPSTPPVNSPAWRPSSSKLHRIQGWTSVILLTSPPARMPRGRW